MPVKAISITYELRDVTHLGGLVGYGGLHKKWYMVNSSITMEAHIASMAEQGWKSPHIIDMPGGKTKIAAFTQWTE